MDWILANAPMFWLIVSVVCAVLEIATLGLTSIWFVVGALAAMASTYFGASFWVQILVFLIVSFLMLLFVRPFAQKHLNNKVQKTNLDSLVGEKCVVLEDIVPFNGTGLVKVDGKQWSVASQNGEEIKAGELVEILEIKGVRLIVKRVNPENQTK